MLGVYLQSLKDKWKSLLVYIFSSLAFSEMYVALYPALKDMLGELERFMSSFPPEFMEAFGFSMEELTFPTVESFLATEMFTFIWPIILIIIAIGLANALLLVILCQGRLSFL